MGEYNTRASWNKMGNVVERIWKDLKGDQEKNYLYRSLVGTRQK